MRVICLENLLLRFLHKVFKILQGHKNSRQLIFREFFGGSHFATFVFFMATLKKFKMSWLIFWIFPFRQFCVLWSPKKCEIA